MAKNLEEPIIVECVECGAEYKPYGDGNVVEVLDAPFHEPPDFMRGHRTDEEWEEEGTQAWEKMHTAIMAALDRDRNTCVSDLFDIRQREEFLLHTKLMFGDHRPPMLAAAEIGYLFGRADARLRERCEECRKRVSKQFTEELDARFTALAEEMEEMAYSRLLIQ